MVYIKELSLVVHEIKGRLFAYRVNKYDLLSNNYKSVESCGNSSALIVSDSHSYLKIIEPQKEFNFGENNQIYSDSPQFRFKNPDFGTYKKLTYYKSLKWEEFAIVGCFKQSDNFKEIEIPAPPNREEEKEEVKIEEKRESYLPEKPGFPPLRTIIQSEPEDPPKPQPCIDPSKISAPKPLIPDIFNSKLRLPPNLLTPGLANLDLGKIPIIHRPQGAKLIIEANQEEVKVQEIEVVKRKNNELQSLKCKVRLPPTHQYEIRVVPINSSIVGWNSSKRNDDQSDDEEIKSSGFAKLLLKNKDYFNEWNFVLIPNEIILDMKTVNLTCDKGSKGDYFWIHSLFDWSDKINIFSWLYYIKYAKKKITIESK